MKYLATLLITFQSFTLLAQVNGTMGKNYIKVTTPFGDNKVNNVKDLGFENSNINIQYFDGLGRSSETVAVGQSYSGNDIIQMFEYDQFGREAVKYMPYTKSGNNGAFVPATDAVAEYKDFYSNTMGFSTEGDDNFTSVTRFENSPLNRPLEQGAPGADWQIGANTINLGYATNIAGDVNKWIISNDGMEAADYALDGTYEEATLYVNITTDENNKSSKEYKNKQGQVVLTEDALGGKTYYIYDDFGLLRCVVPPKAKETVDDKLCYFYRYDGRKRMVAKKIPGADSINMVYDIRDRLVLTQDGNMRAEGKWMVTLYDNFNRPAKTGIYTQIYGENFETFTNLLKTVENLNYFDDKAIEELSETFYDGYDQLEATIIELGLNIDDYDYLPAASADFEASENTAIKGQIAYTKTRIPETGEWLLTINYYDEKYRVIKTIADNHLGGKDIVSNRYDFVGQLIETWQVHEANGTTKTIKKVFAYDRAGRLLNTNMGIDAEPTLSSQNTYNELGQVVGKETNKLENDDVFINTNFGYNIRGWMSNMGHVDNASTELFNMDLGYNQGANAQYNGNISKLTWRSAKNTDNNYYDFIYDDINRLTGANYNGDLNGNYSTTYSYDANGNILTLTRQGDFGGGDFGFIDNLNYDYNGNQLIKVNETTGAETDNRAQLVGFSDNGQISTPTQADVSTHEYHYDANGNLTADHNKQIENVQYNKLNLPKQVDLGENNYIEYLYDAAGIKLKQKVYYDGDLRKEVDYVGNFVYENGSLAYILTDEGRLTPKTGGGYDYEYFIKDHLGNNRVTVWDSAGVAVVQQENHYYPFGMIMQGNSYQNENQENQNKYLYNGKEMQDDHGLDWLDYGARFYDAQIGRWHSVDQHIERYPDITPYTYCANNPIIFKDPTGKDHYYDHDGNYLYSDGEGDNFRLIKREKFEKIKNQSKKSIKGKKFENKKAKNKAMLEMMTKALTAAEAESVVLKISEKEGFGVTEGSTTVDFIGSESTKMKNELSYNIIINLETATVEFGMPRWLGSKGGRIRKKENGNPVIANIHGHWGKERFNDKFKGVIGQSVDDKNAAGFNYLKGTIYNVEQGQVNYYTKNSVKDTPTEYTGRRNAASIIHHALMKKTN